MLTHPKTGSALGHIPFFLVFGTSGSISFIRKPNTVLAAGCKQMAKYAPLYNLLGIWSFRVVSVTINDERLPFIEEKKNTSETSTMLHHLMMSK